MPNNLIEVKDVAFSYAKELILEGIDFNIEAGDFLAFIGPNGGGKSTLMKLLLGLLTPERGDLIRHEKKIGYVPQNTDVNTTFPITALDVVLMGNKRSPLGYSQKLKEKALSSLEAVGLQDVALSRIGSLSGGQRQRVMIARALHSEPNILMLDEPTSNIDPQGQYEIYELLKKLNEKITIVVVSHDIAVVVQYAQKVLYINKTLTFHDISSMRTAFDNSSNEHFCEVELLRAMQTVEQNHQGCQHEKDSCD